MSAVVGIDLGTTNTVVAHVGGGQATALADETGERLIPSVVSFHPSGSVIVGAAARERRLLDARNTVYSVKRLIGRTWGSDDVRRARERSPFELREGPGHAVLVVARGETYTLSEISAYVLRKAKAVAEAALGQTVSKAVITVPANFNDLQRAATKVAGRVAGLEVLRIINEPTAAALAYGFGRSNNERVAVYDFGGGTFDMTLLDLSGNVFEVLATAGDTFLGGDDVDLLIADRMCQAFLREHRYDPRTDPQALERVRLGAEDIKKTLSTQSEASIELRDVGYGPGGKSLSSTFGMTRVELERLIAPLVDRTFEVCKSALATARLEAGDFDQVLLVGGSTRIPMVRDRVAEFFGRAPMANMSPDEVVAIGAAIQGVALSQGARGQAAVEGGGTKVPTLGGLGDVARAVGQPTTARGLGNRMATFPGTGVQPVVVPPGVAGGDRQVSTAEYGLPQPTTPVRIESAPPLPLVVDEAHAPIATGTLPSAMNEARDALERLGAREAQVDVVKPVRPASGPTLTAIAPPMLDDATTRDANVDDGFDDPTTVGVLPGLARTEAIPPELRARHEAPTRPPPPSQGGADGGGKREHISPPAVNPVPPAGDLQRSAPTAPPPLPRQTMPLPVVNPVPPAQRTQPLSPPLPQATQPVATPQAPPVAISDQPTAKPPVQSTPRMPVLIDVTPLSLCVETAGGYRDVIIARNTPIPCDGTRVFATVQNQQRLVRVRVAQGEQARFQDNTVLGELELVGIQEGKRGEVEISVTFEIDGDGLLQVRARDLATGKQAEVRLRLYGAQDHAGAMQARARQDRQIVV